MTREARKLRTFTEIQAFATRYNFYALQWTRSQIGIVRDSESFNIYRRHDTMGWRLDDNEQVKSYGRRTRTKLLKWEFRDSERIEAGVRP